MIDTRQMGVGSKVGRPVEWIAVKIVVAEEPDLISCCSLPVRLESSTYAEKMGGEVQGEAESLPPEAALASFDCSRMSLGDPA